MSGVQRLRGVLGIEQPLLLAPMAYVAGGRLAAAVSAAGGLGLIGGGYGDPEWVGAELDAAGSAAIGIGFITWRLAHNPLVLDLALERSPRAVLLSFGDISPYVARIKSAGARVIAQVQTVAHALAARDAGADVLVAQGAEAGGHAGERSTFPLVPAVVDAVAPLPVVAAGGIADGRGLAAALMLGAGGAMLGSRFYATREALASAPAKQVLVGASGDDTVRGAIFDRLRGWDWPPAYSLRTLANDMTARWPGEAAGLAGSLTQEQSTFQSAVAAADTRIAPVVAGEAADLIRDLPGASELVERIMQDARRLLAQSVALLD